jgi:hypothetical protein
VGFRVGFERLPQSSQLIPSCGGTSGLSGFKEVER